MFDLGEERDVELTEKESASLQRTVVRLEDLRKFLETHQPPTIATPSQRWFTYLAEVKAILGNFSNQLSLVSCLMAKDYLSRQLPLVPFDVAEKPQGANGLDIDERTTTGERVIGEIKTTSPYLKTTFGAAQITALRKDFAKLQLNDAEHKFMFVTDFAAFEALKRNFVDELPGVTIVCLSSDDVYRCPQTPPSVKAKLDGEPQSTRSS